MNLMTEKRGGLMTNNEAIEVLRANYPDACFGQLREAVDMAIAALTRQIENTTQDATQMSLSSAQQSMTATSNTRMSNTVKTPVMDGWNDRTVAICTAKVER